MLNVSEAPSMSAIDWTAVILAAGGIYIALFFAGRWVFQMGYHHE